MALPGMVRLAGAAVGLTGRTKGEREFRFRGLQGVRFGLKVRGNMRAEVRRILRLSREHDQLIVKALNHAARSARTQTTKKLAEKLNVPQKVLRKRIEMFSASRNKKPLRASVWVGTKRAIQAKELSGTLSMTRSGYVKIGRRIYRQAFVARMPGGHEGIFVRRPGARHRRRADGGWTQLPIEEGVVTLLPDARDISRTESQYAQKVIFPKELRRLAEVQLKHGVF